MTITFDEKLEAAWGLHKIEKAVLEKEIAELKAENETLRRDVKTAVMGDSAELADVKRENEKLREALRPFAEVLTLRDCGEVVFENIEIDHVYAARRALGE